jgi:hypothetical protein
MKPVSPFPVQLFVGILYGDPDALERAVAALEKRFGPVEYRSPAAAFDVTGYYEPEMGAPLFRLFVSFSGMVFPNELAKIKIETNEIENGLAEKGRRKVNLDSGYLDYDKVVLASAKYNAQKIYLDLGIWADLTLRFEKGRYFPYPWSFPDFRSGRYDGAFLDMRRLYKEKRKPGMAEHLP